MKNLVTLIFTAVIFSNTFGQTKKDSVILDFIKSQNQYIALADTTNLPKSIKPHYKLILDYFTDLKINANDYFVLTSSIHEEGNLLVFSLFHYKGFVRLKSGERFKGNASGMDGDLEIDTKNKSVISFLMYK